jgi:hypothetical protein
MSQQNETVDFNFAVPRFLYDAIDREAGRLAQTKTALIRMILVEWVEKRRSVTDGIRTES